MKKNYYLYITCILLIHLVSCERAQQPLVVFEAYGQSKLNIQNQSSDQVFVQVKNELNISALEKKLDTVVPAGKSIELLINTETRDYYSVAVNGQQYRLFAQPSAANALTIAQDSTVHFEGDFKVINQFLTSRSPTSDWNPWNEGLHSGASIAAIVASNDSVRVSQQKQLKNYKGLPSWYKEFEHTRLDYINADSDLSALSYRKKNMASQDVVPDDFLATTLDGLSLQNKEFVGVIAYMKFLDSYMEYKIDPNLEISLAGAGKDEMTMYFEKIIKAAEEHISNPMIRETYLAKFFSLCINYLDFIWNDEWIEHLNNPELSNYVKAQIQAKPLLSPGDDIPYFSLSDMDSNLFEPKDFRGKILLINFWGTWCAPCIKEFPYENALVEQFKDQPVVIVNICQESNEEHWRKMVNKNKLKTLNLFANDEWSEKLIAAFESEALPHSILVDANGKVIKNKCPRASAGVDELIIEALENKDSEVTL